VWRSIRVRSYICETLTTLPVALLIEVVALPCDPDRRGARRPRLQPVAQLLVERDLGDGRLDEDLERDDVELAKGLLDGAEFFGRGKDDEGVVGLIRDDPQLALDQRGCARAGASRPSLDRRRAARACRRSRRGDVLVDGGLIASAVLPASDRLRRAERGRGGGHRPDAGRGHARRERLQRVALFGLGAEQPAQQTGEIEGAAVLDWVDVETTLARPRALVEPLDPDPRLIDVFGARRDDEDAVQALDGHESDQAFEWAVLVAREDGLELALHPLRGGEIERHQRERPAL
jgi:hypothetical protein